MASGKSTLAQLLGKRIPDSFYVSEPHEQNRFLALYMRDQQRWGFTAQLCYFYDYVRTFEQARDHPAPRYFFVDAALATTPQFSVNFLPHDHLIPASDYNSYHFR